MKNVFLNPWFPGILMPLLCIGLVCGMYFGPITTATQSLQAETDRYTPNREYTDQPSGAQLLKTATDGLKSAQQKVALVQDQWTAIKTAKNPVIDFSDQYKAWMEWNAECQFDYSQRINAFLVHTGVKPLTFISPLPVVSDPNQPTPQPIFKFPLGAISVFGSYDQITNHIKAWNRFDRIVVIDGLDLTGYNPFLTATYNATEYVYTNNSDKPGEKLAVGSKDAIDSHATFESVPEYQVHIASPVQTPAAGAGGAFGGGFGGGQGPPPGMGFMPPPRR